jgi:hypothetical protein
MHILHSAGELDVSFILMGNDVIHIASEGVTDCHGFVYYEEKRRECKIIRLRRLV